MNRQKLILLGLLIAIIAGVIFLLPEGFLSLENLKSQHTALQEYRASNPVSAFFAFVLVYILTTALSIPGAAILTIAAGATFGLAVGTVAVSIASTIGATIAFLMARYLFRDSVRAKMGDRLAAIEDNLEKDGAFYLFSLRLVPVFPFFAVNILMGLTPIKTLTYALASWAGMLAGTMVYVNAGTQLAKLDSLKGILSPGMIASFVLLAAFPYIAKYGLKHLRPAA